MELTPRQASVIATIRNWKHSYGHSPSFRELAVALHISRPTAIEHVRRLIIKGYVTMQPRLARTLEVVADVQPIPPMPPARRRRTPNPVPVPGPTA